MQIQAEMTDTFGGEANYSWVNRQRLTVKDGATDRQIVIAAKKALGITGVKAYKDWDIGDEQRYSISGACVCFFVSIVY